MDGRILGIDFGLERIGVAVSFGTLAEPLEIIINNQTTITEIERICREQNVKQIVVGISENIMAQKSAHFAKQLQEKLGLPVTLVDETLSSVEVARRLAESKLGKRQYRGAIDHFAAALILERYLDENPPENL